MRRRLVPDLQVAVTIAYTYGWRTQSEVLPLERRHVDLTAGTLRLDPGMTKNDDGRVIYLTSDLKSMLAAQVKRGRGAPGAPRTHHPMAFPARGKGEPGRGAASRFPQGLDDGVHEPPACRAGIATTSAAQRSGIWSTRGVPERVAMTMTGHKGGGGFDRYHIVSPGGPPGSGASAKIHNGGTPRGS